ncbi:MAG: hypothetical protein ACK5WR_00170 [Planctomycetaceae bacterium]|jgi:hypothetical protein
MTADSTEYTDAELTAYLEEGLAAEAMARIEERLRSDDGFRRRVTLLVNHRETGRHSAGDLWRGNRLSCPSRQELGSYLLGGLEEDLGQYIHFHLDTVGCRVCRANLDDLRSSSSDSPGTQSRRQKFFESSVGRIRTGQ